MNLSYTLVLQVCAALVGAIMTFRSKVDADKTEAAVKRASLNGGRQVIARKNVRIENVIFAIQLSLFLVGVVTMFEGEMPPAHPEVVRIMRVRSVEMAFISFLCMWLSYRNWVELTPIMALRRSDATANKNGLVNVVSSAKVAQDLAATAQVAAAGAQTAASDAQATAADILEAEHTAPHQSDGAA